LSPIRPWCTHAGPQQTPSPTLQEEEEEEEEEALIAGLVFAAK
jgi:hypothetical protein